MKKSDIINEMVKRNPELNGKTAYNVVNEIINQISESLVKGGRTEIRGFGSFSLHYRPARIGRNPKTGEQLEIADKHVAFFKPSKELKDRVNNGKK